MPFPITCDITIELLSYITSFENGENKGNLILQFFEKRSKGENINSQKMLTKFVMSLLYFSNSSKEVDYWRALLNSEVNNKEICLFLNIRKTLINTKFNGTYHSVPDTLDNITLSEDDWVNLCKKIFLNKVEMQKFIDKLSKGIQTEIIENKTKRIQLELSFLILLISVSRHLHSLKK